MSSDITKTHQQQSPAAQGDTRVSPWNDPAKRALAFQVVLVGALLAMAWYLGSNVIHNLESRGITTGFAFLHQEAGFGIPLSLIPYSEASTYGRTFFVGLLNTVMVSALGIIAATILGFIIGIARLSENWLVAKLSAVYVEIFRNIPLLLQIFFWYFAVLRTLPSPRQSIEFLGSFLNIRGLYMPQPVSDPGFGAVWIALAIAIVVTWVIKRWAHKRQDATGQIFPTGWVGLGLIVGLPLLTFFIAGSPMHLNRPELHGFNFNGGFTLLPELVALWLALTIYTAAFIAETVRGGILAVPHGQVEACKALGLSRMRTLRLVVIPQAMRVIIPPLTSQYLNLTKNSSLATAIGYPDLVSVFAGTTLNQTGQALEIISMTMAVYLTLSILTSLGMGWYNKRKALIER